MRVTRRGLQVALGLIWLADAGLQLQPYMFSHHFANALIGGTASVQPFWIVGGVHLAAHVINTAPIFTNTLFALAQFGLGAGLLWRRTARLALAASIAWSLAVWYFAEALGGVASGHASLVTGFPGAVSLYALLALTAWPGREPGSARQPPSPLVLGSWAAVWALGGVFQALPGQASGHDLAASITGVGATAPGWLASADRAVAGGIAGSGQTWPRLMSLVALGIAIATLVGKRTARIGAILGALGAVGIWVVGEGFGQIYTGQGTDPNSGPLLLLMAVAAYSAAAPLDTSSSSGLDLIVTSLRPAMKRIVVTGARGERRLGRRQEEAARVAVTSWQVDPPAGIRHRATGRARVAGGRWPRSARRWPGQFPGSALGVRGTAAMGAIVWVRRWRTRCISAGRTCCCQRAASSGGASLPGFFGGALTWAGKSQARPW